MAADGYIRLTALEPRVYGDLVSPESVLFIDVPPGIRLKRLRDVSPTRLHAGAQLVVRSEHAWEDLIGLKETLRIEGPLARISHPLGQQPLIEGAHPGLDPSEVVERCRAVELRALLTFGGAVWHPEGYHYLLPSGGHATGFVRLADSMRSPHDTNCLADWVAADVSEACALIADTDTLTPLILAVQLRMARAGMSGGPVHILDHYPRTQADTDAMIREAGREAGHILFLLSVNSSGSVRDRVLRSLELAEGQFESWSLHVFVSNTPVPEGITGVHWLPLPGEDPLVDAPEAQGCHACRDPARSVVVPIDPWTFDGRLPDEVIKDTPSVTDPQRNREFFEVCDSQKAIGVEEPPADAVLGFRSSERMALKVRFERLVGTADFAELVRTKMEQVDEIRPADLVLVPEHEWNLEGFSRFRDRAMSDLVAADPEVVVSFPVDDE